MKLAAIITLIVVVVIIFLSFGGKFWGPSYAKLDDFAKCLTEKNTVMYGADWCPHCQNEKKRFGDSFKFVSYIECPENPKLCLDAGIKGYPTWILGDGTKFEGEQGIKKLAEVSGCLPPNKQ